MFEPVLLKNIDVPDGHLLSTYEAGGGYQALAKVLREHTPDEIIDLVKQSNLRGRGGAGFPTGMKWSFVPKQADKPKYLCCNADEGEPGTFKDRIIMERDPHQLIEGLAVSAYAIGAKTAYVYIRGEYVTAIRRLEQAIAEAHEKGYLGTSILGSDFEFRRAYPLRRRRLYLRRGDRDARLARGQAGAAAIETAVSGRRRALRQPDGDQQCRDARLRAAYRDAGARTGFGASARTRAPARSSTASAGRCANPASTSCRWAYRCANWSRTTPAGRLPGRKIKAVIPGGVSAPVIPEHGLEVGMDFDLLAAAGSMLGSAGVIVIDDSTCMVKVATRIIEFFHHESCGKCTPCREGLNWVVKVLRRIEAGAGRTGRSGAAGDALQGHFRQYVLRPGRRRGDGVAGGTRAFRR